MAKKLPSSIEIEEALLWAILIDDSVFEKFLLEWELEYFYNHPTLTLITEICEMKFAWLSVDLITIKNQLEKKWLLDKIGWMSYIVDLTADASSFNWETYFRQLELMYKQREIIKQARILEANAYDWTNLDNTIMQTFENINSVLIQWKVLSTKMDDNIALLDTHIEESKSKKLFWYSWWNKFLDQATGWIRKSKTYRIGAPSWVGKTNLVYQTIKHLLEQKAKVLFISLENSVETTYIKFLSSIQEVNPNQIEKGEVKPDYDYLRKHKENFILTDCLFDLDDIKREVLKTKPDVVILDYIGLITIKWCDERSLYNKYADEVKQFIQRNKYIAWIDLSNLNTDEEEEKIRIYGKFNWSAKLKNNTDFGLHMFYYKPFYEYKNRVKEMWSEEAYDKFKVFQTLTFLITKNRLWPQFIEKEFTINFDKWINYYETTRENKDKWKELNWI